MNYYLAEGRDSISDAGVFSILVKAKDSRQAVRRIKEHLRRMDRLDLLTNALECHRVVKDNVLFSNVEKLYG